MPRSTAIRRLTGIALAATAVTGLTLTTAGTASAATHKNGNVESGEFGLYYNSNYAGCVFDLLNEDGNFADNRFISSTSSQTCPGQGQITNDNTASYWNRDVTAWDVYTDAGRKGIHGYVPLNYYGNASATYKNEISSSYPF
ncbi:peptidase inhibitor family I36 protein [Streptomyces sp. NBC_00385]|uniref:peptidase inhibitor family I36 protein n=1 Tax=Streptomyces sp. NBC_00385 TaxID=2975733 RepID=UPI002DD91B82|nr:peptidase inhibitor family I36 protein [Streptomyces sp. NBC_00385]WRZ04602.1 peptidase inhibitor family I36 protein [Streptomyces sp. NBC_00385]